jgi:hypothetical protein
MVLQGSRRSRWTPTVSGQVVLGLRWLLLLVGRDRWQSAERTHAFVKVRQRRFGGWHGGGGAALPSSSGVRPVRVVFVSFVWVSSTSALGVRCRCMCLMLMF